MIKGMKLLHDDSIRFLNVFLNRSTQRIQFGLLLWFYEECSWDEALNERKIYSDSLSNFTDNSSKNLNAPKPTTRSFWWRIRNHDLMTTSSLIRNGQYYF